MLVRLRRAVPADGPTLLACQIAAFQHDSVLYPEIPVGGPPDYTSLAVLLQRMNDGICYVIEADEQSVGGILIYDEGAGHAHLELIYLDPAQHSRGIGSQALKQLEALHPTMTLWTLHTPAWALRNHHFYEKLGYNKVGEDFIDDTPLFAYEKRLATP
jgi:GNAT superfamily N-acetyltransferase